MPSRTCRNEQCIDGKLYARDSQVADPNGTKCPDCNGICRDCAAKPGERHHGGCDVSRCLWTGMQELSCDGSFADIVRQLRSDGHDDMAERLAYHLGIKDENHDCGEDIWTGEWPGLEDCRRLDLWCYWGPGWIKCESDHPEARESLNDLVACMKWNRDKKRWERP